MAATIKDVARRARVSIASVSRTLNHAASVAPEIRARVLRAATSLRYTPHGLARGLSSRRTHTIGLLLPDLHGGYFSELIRGVDAAVQLRGLHLLVCGANGQAHQAAEALRLMNGRVDGVLIMAPHADGDALGAALPEGLPAVLMNTRPAAVGARPALIVDDYGGARAVTRHLLECGHRRIAHIRGQERHFESLERQRGCVDALRAAGAPPAQFIDGDFTEAAGYLAGRALASSRRRPQAVFAANDMMAIGCLRALTEAGIQVPGEMALAGFDDIPLARYVTPPLTTVRADIAGMGQRALERLVAWIAGADPRGRAAERLPVELVVRASCGARPGLTP